MAELFYYYIVIALQKHTAVGWLHYKIPYFSSESKAKIMNKQSLAELLQSDLENAKKEVEEEFGKKNLKERNKASKPKKTEVRQDKHQMSSAELYENIQTHKKEIALKGNQGKKSAFILEEYHQKLLPIKMSSKINMTDALNYFIGHYIETEAYKEFVQKLKNGEIR